MSDESRLKVVSLPRHQEADMDAELDHCLADFRATAADLGEPLEAVAVIGLTGGDQVLCCQNADPRDLHWMMTLLQKAILENFSSGPLAEGE